MRAILLATAVAAALSSAPAHASGLTEADFRDVVAGKIPARTESFTTEDGRAAGRAVGAILVERPLADVWATLIDYDHRVEYIPRLKNASVLDRSPTRLRVRQEIDASVKTFRYTAWFDLDAATHTIHWKLDPTADNNIKDVEGEYRLLELAPGRTVVVYRAFLDSGLKVPQGLQNYLARRSIPDLMKAIKQRVESGNTWHR